MDNISYLKKDKMRKSKKSRTSHLNPKEKFEYYFNLRMGLLRSALRGVGNLSNRNVYDVPDKAKEIIEKKIKEWTKEFVYDKWSKSSKKVDRNRKAETLFKQYFKE